MPQKTIKFVRNKITGNFWPKSWEDCACGLNENKHNGKLINRHKKKNKKYKK